MGTGPYGIGTPITARGNIGPILADSLAKSQGSRWINPRTGRYEFDSNGRVKGMANVPHLVQLALTTLRGSAAYSALGVEAPGGKIGNQFVQERTAQITEALQPLMDRDLIELVQLLVDTSVRPVMQRVVFRDLTTEREHIENL